MERRAAWARSRSSASSAAVTRTPIVRVRRSDSPSRGLAMLSLTRLGPYRFGRDHHGKTISKPYHSGINATGSPRSHHGLRRKLLGSKQAGQRQRNSRLNVTLRS